MTKQMSSSQLLLFCACFTAIALCSATDNVPLRASRISTPTPSSDKSMLEMVEKCLTATGEMKEQIGVVQAQQQACEAEISAQKQAAQAAQDALKAEIIVLQEKVQAQQEALNAQKDALNAEISNRRIESGLVTYCVSTFCTPLPQDVTTFICDTLTASGDTSPSGRRCRSRVHFSKPFPAAPEVLLGLQGIDADQSHNVRLRPTAEEVATDGFTLVVATWGDTVIYDVRVGWLAYMV